MQLMTQKLKKSEHEANQKMEQHARDVQGKLQNFEDRFAQFADHMSLLTDAVTAMKGDKLEAFAYADTRHTELSDQMALMMEAISSLKGTVQQLCTRIPDEPQAKQRDCRVVGAVGPPPTQQEKQQQQQLPQQQQQHGATGSTDMGGVSADAINAANPAVQALQPH